MSSSRTGKTLINFQERLTCDLHVNLTRLCAFIVLGQTILACVQNQHLSLCDTKSFIFDATFDKFKES